MFERKRGSKVFLRSGIVSGVFSLLVLIFLSFGYQNAFASGAPAIVDTQWLADNMGGKRIVHVGTPAPQAPKAYGMKHVDGAMFLSTKGLLNVLGNGVKPPDKAKFEALMSKFGISNDTHVVIYGADSGNPFSVNAFWLMKYFGHEKVSYLDGGIKKWAREKRKTVSGPPPKVDATKYSAAPDPSILASADYVLQNLNNDKVLLVDTRAKQEYKGNPRRNKRGGHIPGAVLLEFRSTNVKKDGTFKSAGDLKSAYEAKGVKGDKEIITYCQAGIRAAHTYIILKHVLGYPNVRNYVGSIAEWSRLDPKKYPMVK